MHPKASAPFTDDEIRAQRGIVVERWFKEEIDNFVLMYCLLSGRKLETIREYPKVPQNTTRESARSASGP